MLSLIIFIQLSESVFIMNSGQGLQFQDKDIKPGTLLMSEPFMKDPNFLRKVVMMVKHDEEGSLGFVLNQLSDWTVHDLIEDFPLSSYPIYVGGPVSQNTLHYLHQLEELSESAMPITEGLFWGGDFDQLKAMVEAGEVDQNKIRFFIGYSGWSANQLLDELKEQSWLISQRNPVKVLRYEDHEMWKALVTELGKPFNFWAIAPIDPGWN